MLKRQYRKREKEKQREQRNRGKHRVTEEKEIERNGERVIES